MENKLVIAIVALMVAALAAPAVMAATVNYEASVVTSSVTVTTPGGTTFGDLLAGTTDNEITGSLTLANNGGADAIVDAKFTTNDGEATPTYGLTTTSNNVIGGNHFKIGTDGYEFALSYEDSDTALGSDNQVPAGESVSYNAILDVPSGQAPGIYSGTVQLTFTAVV
ncbi:MAG: hypothetical protein KAJ93_06030 [Methanosarcinales archaeon]|nr:hypothetical protein [Methanosarcinales archaeon]